MVWLNCLLMAPTVLAQSLLPSDQFFNPDFEARRPGAVDPTVITVDTTLYTPAAQTTGSVTWEHSAGGLVQAGVLGVVDQQLAAYTRTQGDSLIFGRELETAITGVISGEDLTDLTNSVVGASAINSWLSTATVADLSLSQGVLYSVSFDVSTGAGLNLSALSYANFTLLNGATPIQGVNFATETLDVLDLLTIGGGTTNIDLQFYAPAGLTDLGFEFEAATIADVNLLGTIEDNQTVLQFTNFSVAPIPEASSLVMAALGFMAMMRRRRPCGV